MPLPAPITRVDHHVLRAAVIDFKEAVPRRRTPVALRVGVPSRAVAAHVVERGQALDHALCTDIAAALLQRTEPQQRRWAWLTRDGTLALHDVDVEWSAAWYAACSEAGVDVPFVVVTRKGWRDPRTGVVREWSRLRRRSARPVVPDLI